MITADQILAHAIGDYILQSHWMSTEKTKTHVAAAVHASFYSLPFLFFRPSVLAFAVIIGTHFFIDRYRLARYVCWAKNFLAPKYINQSKTTQTNQQGQTTLMARWKIRNLPFSECAATGYPPETPAWLSVWLMIIADNICHILINGLALKYL